MLKIMESNSIHTKRKQVFKHKYNTSCREIELQWKYVKSVPQHPSFIFILQSNNLNTKILFQIYTLAMGHHPVHLLKYYYYYYFNCIQQVDHMIMVGKKSRGLSWGCGILFLQAYILYKCSLMQQGHQLKS